MVRAAPVIAHAAPPAPVIAAPAVSFGRIAVRLGAGTRRIEVQADGRITARRSVPPGPRRLSVPVPVGVHPVRVRAIGPGGVALVGHRAGAGAAAVGAARRPDPGLGRPPAPGRRRPAGRRDAGDLRRLRPAPGHGLRRAVERRRPVPGGLHAEGGDPGRRRPPRPGRRPAVHARPDGHRLRRRRRQQRAGVARRRVGRRRRPQRHRHPPRPRPRPVPGAPPLHHRGRPPAARDPHRPRRPRSSPTSSPRPTSWRG